MNQDILTGKWKQMRGQVKQWWGKLTDDDLDRIDGAMDKLEINPNPGGTEVVMRRRLGRR